MLWGRELMSLCADMGWSAHYARGYVMEWRRATRAMLLASGPLPQVRATLPECNDEPTRIMSAMLRAGFAIGTDEGGAAVVGNAAHLRMVDARRDAGARGLKARQSKKKPRKPRAPKQESLLPVETGPQAVAREAWERYAGIYKRMYNTDPPRNPKVNGQMAYLVQRVGRDAPALLEFYLGHTDPRYKRNTHQLGLALADAESLLVQMKSGRIVTQHDVAAAGRDEALRAQMRRIDEASF